MNELKVISTKHGVIETNFKEFHKELKLAIKDYQGLVVTEENLKDMKGTRLELSKAIKIIDTERKVQKKAFIVPLTQYEDECKQAIETIRIAESELMEKINVFDERTRQEKLEYAAKTAIEIGTALELEPEYQARIDVSKKEFSNLTMTKKKILTDIKEQATSIEKLQKAKHANREYVVNQLVTASKLAGLSTPLVNDDISHLISDYETMDVLKVTEGITSVAMRRKEAEQLAVKQMEERVRLEEQRKAEAKERAERERILAEERAKEKIERERLEAERLASLEAEEQIETIPNAISFGAEDCGPVSGFVSEEEAEKDQQPAINDMFDDMFDEKIVVVRVFCKKSQTVDIIRLLAINDFDCEVE